METIFKISIVILTILLFNACKKDKPSTARLTTSVVTEVSYTSAISGGDVTDEGGVSVFSRGICWNTSADPTTSNSKTTESGGLGAFTINLTGLIPNTKYYVWSFATNSAGTGYGNQVIFTTKQLEVPGLSTTAITEITKTTAKSGGNVTAENGSSVTGRGVCWASTINPTTSNYKTSDGSGTGAFTSSMTGLIAGIVYYVRAYSTNSTGTSYGNEISFSTSPATLPKLITAWVTELTMTTVKSGGFFIEDGGAAITDRGLCWSLVHNPDIAGNKISEGTGSGSFISSISGLTPNTTYYLRAYATNSAGTNYGNELVFKTCSFLDNEGNSYHDVTIGTQTWMMDNLKATKYSNGDPIGTSSVTQDLSGENSPKYQWPFDGLESRADLFGRFYTWYAVTDSRNICPTGWHVPTQNEFATLESYLFINGYGYEGSGDDIGKALASTTGWITSSTSGAVGNNADSNNSSGFNGIATGLRYFGGGTSQSALVAYFWTASEKDSQNAFYRSLGYYSNSFILASSTKKTGFPVRCIKN